MAAQWMVILIFYIHCRVQANIETFECIGIDSCKQQTIQCKAGSDCIIICNGKTACLDVMVIGLSAKDVTVICTPEDTCKGGTLLCGSGHCLLDCMAASGKNICNGLSVHLHNAISFDCPDQCPSDIVPLVMTAKPTTTTTTTSTTAIPTIKPTITEPSSTSTSLQTRNINVSRNSTTQSAILTQNPTIPVSTSNPTNNPITYTPTILPTENPTETPTIEPTIEPTLLPTADTSLTPTAIPTIHPTTTLPTDAPTNDPTDIPTNDPTDIPTIKPTYTPSGASSTTSIISSTQDTEDNVHIDERDEHTPSPLFRPQSHNITRVRTNVNAEESVTIIDHLENINILWYISTAAMVILCCSLFILIAFCLSVHHDIKSVESDLSADLADLQALKIKQIIAETYSPLPIIEHEYEYEFEANENKNSNAASTSSSETSNTNVEYEDYEDYDEYDELREGSACTPMVKHVSEEERKAEEKQMQIKSYSVAIDRANRTKISSYSKSSFPSFPSVLALHNGNNPFLIEPVPDDNEQEFEYDAHYLKISALRGKSLSINPEISIKSFWSDSTSKEDVMSCDVTHCIEHLDSETVVHIDDSGLIPPIFNVPVSQVTLDREPSCDQSPTLSQILITDDSLFDDYD